MKPSPTSHEEHLRYTIEPAGDDAAIVSLAWEKRAVTFRVELKTPRRDNGARINLSKTNG